jgi:hypothetical protein
VNEISAAIYNKLKADSTLTGYLAAGTASIYEDMAPQKANRPYVIFSKASDRDGYTLSTEATIDFIYTVKAVTDTPAGSPSKKTAGTIAARIKTVLNDAPLTITGRTWLSTRRESAVEYPEQANSRIYWHVGGLYRIWIAP